MTKSTIARDADRMLVAAIAVIALAGAIAAFSGPVAGKAEGREALPFDRVPAVSVSAAPDGRYESLKARLCPSRMVRHDPGAGRGARMIRVSRCAWERY